MDNKEIRFIDSRYNELFRIPDGGQILITFANGKELKATCKYIDEYHTDIDGRCYHICQWAELNERDGRTYKAIEPPLFTLEHIEPEDMEHLYRKQYTCPRGCIGYIRGDFSQSGKEFYSTWFPDDNKLYTEHFRNELDEVINFFRSNDDMPLLKSRADMHNVCASLNAPKHENCGLTIYALKVETEKHTYYFWCNPSPKDYNFRVMCYDSKKHLRYKDELLTLTHVDRLEDDKIFLNENGATEMYFNIDAGAGGQVVINEISKDLIRESAKYNKDADDFFEFLGGGCKQYLVDMGTPEFKSTFLEFVTKKADYEGINDKTVKGLKKHAGIDKSKTEPER